MISPVKGSKLAEQIERARQRIERWPQWLKDAAGIDFKEPEEPVESGAANEPLRCWPRLCPGDFMD